MMEIVNNIIVVLFVLFLVYIFRGYHLSRLDKIEKEKNNEEF
ncbi:hypothetical protein [Sulfuricurvum sp.]|nr:hypothetical protein [Sulfuricurvum sp.]